MVTAARCSRTDCIVLRQCYTPLRTASHWLGSAPARLGSIGQQCATTLNSAACLCLLTLNLICRSHLDRDLAVAANILEIDLMQSSHEVARRTSRGQRRRADCSAARSSASCVLPPVADVVGGVSASSHVDGGGQHQPRLVCTRSGTSTVGDGPSSISDAQSMRLHAVAPASPARAMCGVCAYRPIGWWSRS